MREGNLMKSKALWAAVMTLAVLTAPAAAAPAEHEVYVETYDETEHLSAAENFCGRWATTFREVRNGTYRIVAPGGISRPDELHINGVVNGSITLRPDDSSLPTYAGAFREKLNGLVTVIDDSDVERVAQFRLRSTLRGTDGSQLRLKLWGKITVNGNGDLVVERGDLVCG
jgi:hypothetical protein